MQCPFCRAENDRVVDSRTVDNGTAVRRRRLCLACDQRFTTYERPEVAPRIVVKKDGSRESFSREKVLRGMIRACEKRHINQEQLSRVGDQIEGDVLDRNEREVNSSTIGEWVSAALRELDQVAYVRFTSVYREFGDIRDFIKALTPVLNTGRQQDNRGEPGTDQ